MIVSKYPYFEKVVIPNSFVDDLKRIFCTFEIM